jgi:hypothetical protein
MVLHTSVPEKDVHHRSSDAPAAARAVCNYGSLNLTKHALRTAFIRAVAT